MQLYVHPLSGHSHRAVLFAALIDVEVEVIEVDLAAGAHKAPEFLAKNPFGQVPVLVDGTTIISDSIAILVYLAKTHGRSDWLPESPLAAAQVQRWLSVAQGEIARGPAAARLVTVFNAPIDAEDAIRRAHDVLPHIDAQLADATWLTGAEPTVADVAIYSYLASAPEGNVALDAYPNVQRWLNSVEALPGFVPFARTPVGLAA